MSDMVAASHHHPSQLRRYHRLESVVFLKTTEAFGGLSNMAGGYPLCVGGQHIRSTEALYQACRFPWRPDLQEMILAQRSPMTAKMKVKPYLAHSRPDWQQARVTIMRWCLRVKLAQNWSTWGSLLLSTGDRPIVEESRKDDFWGAFPRPDEWLVGMNVLGRLLMELREALRSLPPADLLEVKPPSLPNFLLLGQPIGVVVGLDTPSPSRPIEHQRSLAFANVAPSLRSRVNQIRKPRR